MWRRFPIFIIIIIVNFSCRGPEGPQGLPGPNLEALTDPTIMPVILSTYPPANSEGPYADFGTSEIQIRFNKIMDRASVIRALRIGSSRRVIKIDTNEVHSVGGDLFTFNPIDDLNLPITLWKIRERDTITIDATAKDINGNFLSSPYTFTFMPEPRFRVVRVFPSNGATDVPADTILRIVFNSYVGLYIGDNTVISPSAGGRWYLTDPMGDKTSIDFYPTTSLSTNTKYDITINGLTMDLDGYQLGNNYTWSFTTGSFEVLSMSPPDGTTQVHLYRPISVFLTSPLDSGTIRAAFSISPPTPGNLTLFERFTGFTFVPNPELLPDTPYTVRIDTTIRSLIGEKISSPEEIKFRTDIFRTILTSPSNGERNVTRLLFSIEMYFNSIIDTSTVRSAFIAPGIQGYFELVYNSNSFSFYPTNTPLSPNTTYVISITRNLRSIGGVPLGEPYTFTFTTTP